jgi:hypothetical protein
VAVFPADRSAGKQQSATIYLDAGLTRRAPITDANGNTIASAQIAADDDHLWPIFQSAASVVYYRNANTGKVETMRSAGIAAGTTISITGSRGGNAALASLIAGLIAAGVPITDNTSA